MVRLKEVELNKNKPVANTHRVHFSTDGALGMKHHYRAEHLTEQF